MELVNILKDDWNKIPSNYRFMISAGVFLIFNSWLLDHWGGTSPYTFWGLDIRAGGYSLGLTLILLSFGLLIAKQVVYYKNILSYRHKYPLKKLNKDFVLISFRGYVVLFDLKKKRIFSCLSLGNRTRPTIC